MKISKIFAGMSAAAIAASMMAALPASAVSETPAATVFGVQGFEQDNVAWSWQAKDANATEDGKIELTYNYADLITDAQKEAGINSAGIQFFSNPTQAENEEVTATIEYTVKANGVEKSDKLEYSRKWDKTARNWSVSDEKAEGAYGAFVDNGTINPFDVKEWSDLTDLGDITITATVSDIAVKEIEAEPEDTTVYTLPQTLEFPEEEYAADWSEADGLVDYKYIQSLPEGESLDVTVKVTLDGTRDYYIIKPFNNAAGWPGLTFTSDYAVDTDYVGDALNAEKDERTKNGGGPMVQADAKNLLLFYADGAEQTLKFTITPEGMDAIREQFADEGWGGIGFSVYGVNVKEVTVAQHTEEDSNVVNVEYNQKITADSNFSIKSSDFEDTYTKADLHLNFSALNWNDWCPVVVKVTAGDTVKYYALTGKEVGWDITAEVLSVDEDGDADKVVLLPQDKDDFIANNKDYKKDPDAFVIPDYEIIKTIAAGDYTLSIPEIGDSDEWQIDFYCYAWNAKDDKTPDKELLNDPDYKANIEGLAADDNGEKWVFELVSVDFTKGEVTPVEPGDEPKDEPKEDPKDEPKDEPKTEPKKVDSKPTGGDNTSNPKTGAAALALGTIALAGAAVVVSKKKD